MTTPYRKKLIEVSLPLAAINSESAREKSIRHGHPATLHLWWARRPLAACRAVLFSSLVDDPDSDPQYRKPDGSVDEDSAGIKRADLFNLIEELVAWENSNNPEVIRSARAEIARCVASRKIELEELAPDYELSPGNGKGPKVTVQDLVTKGHCRPQAMGLDKKAGRVRFSFDVSRLPPADVVNAFLAEHAPPVLDPFAGGGSIPLEAQRLGLRAYASDLNPVSVLINKALIEIPAKFAGRPPVNPGLHSEGSAKGKGGKGKALMDKIDRDWVGATGLAEDVRYYGKWMRDEAEKQIGHLYPKVDVTHKMAEEQPELAQYAGKTLTVIAWLWARTVRSPDPAVEGAHVPLISTYYVCQKAGKEAWIAPHFDRASNSYSFTIHLGKPSEDSKTKVSSGTKTGRGVFKCILSNEPIDAKHMKEEGNRHRIGHVKLAVIAEGTRQRVYLSPLATNEPLLQRSDFLDDLACPEISGYFNPPIYGYKTVGSLFTTRQKTALETFASLVHRAFERCMHDCGDEEYARSVATYLALGVGRLSNRLTSFCIWDTGRENIAQTFSEQGVPMSWDYVEVNPFSGATGSWDKSLEYIPPCIELSPCGHGEVRQHDAALSHSGFIASPLISTDPPYYSSIAYADFADFFYGTLRASLRRIYPTLLSTMATPKEAETVAAWHRHNGDRGLAAEDFTRKLLGAVRQVAQAASTESPVTIYYAFKQREFDNSEDALVTAWESILKVIITGGLQILNTWPIRTEQTSGRKADKNSLASSIVIVCRRIPEDARRTTRKEFISALRHELPEALRNLQRGNIAPVDLAQSAIGPGMAVFTRYSKVLESDGSSMSVRTALGLINQSLDEVLAEQEGEFDGDTRWAISWFEQFGVEEGPFGDAETLSKAKNTAVNGLVEAGIVVAKSGKVRLIRRDELPKDWNPATDKRLTVWEITQHLIHRLDEQGEIGAAQLVAQLGSVGEIARDLAYRLYSTCERKKWAQEAMAYNTLVVAWPELTKLALSNRPRQESIQPELF